MPTASSFKIRVIPSNTKAISVTEALDYTPVSDYTIYYNIECDEVVQRIWKGIRDLAALYLEPKYLVLGTREYEKLLGYMSVRQDIYGYPSAYIDTFAGLEIVIEDLPHTMTYHVSVVPKALDAFHYRISRITEEENEMRRGPYPRERGKCSICRFTFNILRTGLIQDHWQDSFAGGRILCSGSGLKPQEAISDS